MSDDFKEGHTSALDINDVEAQRRNAPAPDEWAGGAKGWEDNPWDGGEGGRNWAKDERWTGEDGTHRKWEAGGDSTMALDLASLSPKDGDGALVDEKPPEFETDGWSAPGGDAKVNAGARGWSAPKRDEVMASGGGWDDWNDAEVADDGTMALSLEGLDANKEQGGRRKNQAARSYERDSSSAYGDGKHRRQDLYREKEDYDDRGYQQYGGGKRETYGQDQTFGNDNWSSNPDGGRRPAAAPGGWDAPPPPSGGGLPPSGGGFPGGGGGFPGGSGLPPGAVMGQNMPATLAPDERTAAIDISQADAFLNNDAPVAAPNERTMAFDDPSQFNQLQGGGGAPPMAMQTTGSLVVFTPDNPPVPYELGPGVTSVGRGLDNDLVLSDPFTSRKHFLIVHKDNQFEVRDSGTDNGTNINSQRVTHALLRPGDHIEVGQTVLRFVAGAAGQNDMVFGPAPPIPPQHLAAPPDASGLVPIADPSMMGGGPGMHGMPMHGQPKKSKAGLVIALVLGFLVLAGGGVAAFFLLGGEEKKAKSNDDVDSSTQVDVDDTGYEQGGGSDGEAKVRQAMEDHDAAGEDDEGGGAAAASATPPAEGGGAGDAAGKDPGASAAPAKSAPPVIVAGLVGSVAMATGKPRPLQMTLAGEPVDIKIDTEPVDALIYDSNDNLIGRTPYHITEIKYDAETEWEVRKSGFDNESVKIDFAAGSEHSLTLSKAAAREKKRERKKKRDRPTTTNIPTVD